MIEENVEGIPNNLCDVTICSTAVVMKLCWQRCTLVWERTVDDVGVALSGRSHLPANFSISAQRAHPKSLGN